MSQHTYGWIRELPDHRNIPLGLFEPPPPAEALPPHIDLTSQMPPVYDQGGLNSCTGNAAAAMFRYVVRKLGLADEDLSRMFIWYEARKRPGMGWETLNAGSYIRDAMAILADEGAPPETDWPYVQNKYAEAPSQIAYDDAKAHEATVYLTVDQNTDAMRACLAAGFPLEIGFSLFENFESAETSSTGVVQMPSGSMLGGHAVLIVGYDDPSQRWIVRNSWGNFWGNDGNCTMPYEYLARGDLASDLWTIRQVTGPIGPPVEKPTILKALVKAGNQKIKIFGSWKPGASFYLNDTHLSGNDWGGGLFIAKHILGVSGNNLIVKNPDGISSKPYTI